MTINLKNATAPKEAAALQTTQKVESKEVKKTETKDTLTSAAQTTQATKKEEKSFMQKVKDCCAGILNWLKEHIFCCFFKKKSDGSETATATKDGSTTATKKAPSVADEAALIKQAKSGLSKEENEKFEKDLNEAINERNDAIKPFTDFFDLVDQLKKIASSKKSDKEILADFEQVSLQKDIQDSLRVLLEKDKKAFFEALDELAKPFQAMITLMEQATFGEMIEKDQKAEKDKKLTPSLKKAFYCSLSSPARVAMLDAYKTKSGKSDITEEQFLALVLNNTDKDLNAVAEKAVQELQKAMTTGGPAGFLTPALDKVKEMAQKVSKAS